MLERNWVQELGIVCLSVELSKIVTEQDDVWDGGEKARKERRSSKTEPETVEEKQKPIASLWVKQLVSSLFYCCHVIQIRIVLHNSSWSVLRRAHKHNGRA